VSQKITWPVVTGALELVTVASSETGRSYAFGFPAEVDKAILVAAGPDGDTTTDVDPLLLAELFASPEYEAVTLCVPTESVAVANVACAVPGVEVALKVPVPSMVVPS
jgi:hypothetical protein